MSTTRRGVPVYEDPVRWAPTAEPTIVAGSAPWLRQAVFAQTPGGSPDWTWWS